MQPITSLTAEGCRARRQRLCQLVGDGPELLCVADPQYLSSLANYWASPFQFRSANAAALLLIDRDGGGTLVIDDLLRGYAAEAHVERVASHTWYDGARSARARRPSLIESALEAVSRSIAEVGVETAATPIALIDGLRATVPGLAVTAIDAALHALKRRKDADELAVIETSLRAAEAGLEAARQRVEPGWTEFDVYRLVVDAAERALGQAAIVYGDFVSGPRCESGGGPPTDRVLERGDLLLLDFSVVVRGYRGDFATTFRVGDDPTPEQERFARACREALAAGEELLHPGRAAREIDAAIRAVFARYGLEPYFTSHSGHGIGLGHPDPPYLVRESDETLALDDVVTLEPGLYVPGVAGMRFEHVYQVTADGPRRLSNHRLDLKQ